MVRAAGLEPAQAFRPHGFSYHFGFRRRHLAFVVWTIPSPWRSRCRCCPSSLYTFPLAGAWLGIASEGFPDFEQFCTQGFPQGTQWLKSDASTSFATPAWPHLYVANRLRQREYSCFRTRINHRRRLRSEHFQSRPTLFHDRNRFAWSFASNRNRRKNVRRNCPLLARRSRFLFSAMILIASRMSAGLMARSLMRGDECTRQVGLLAHSAWSAASARPNVRATISLGFFTTAAAWRPTTFPSAKYTWSRWKTRW